LKSEAAKTNESGFLSGSETALSKDGKEKGAGSGKKLKSREHYPGILEEGLVYSCAGPRIDPEEA